MNDDFDLVSAMLAIAVLLVTGQQYLLKHPDLIEGSIISTAKRGREFAFRIVRISQSITSAITWQKP